VSLLLGIATRHEQVSPISIAGAGVCLTGAWLIKSAAAKAAHGSRETDPRRAASEGSMAVPRRRVSTNSVSTAGVTKPSPGGTSTLEPLPTS
jgi:hypothetical protein